MQLQEVETISRNDRTILKGKPALLFQNELAANEKIGLNGAIVLQQLHYWIEQNRKKNRGFNDGRYWVYNTYDNWTAQFPFWSKSTVERIFSDLKKLGVVLTGKYNKSGFDQTLWYTIDYDKLMELIGKKGTDAAKKE
ncbi:MAG: hypothetical protein BACD_02475 [Bacteroides rodentium]